jgi:hypothetical protein
VWQGRDQKVAMCVMDAQAKSSAPPGDYMLYSPFHLRIQALIISLKKNNFM